MSDEQAIRRTVLEILGGIAPEADLAALAPEANFRRELDLDSMDFQNFVIRLCRALAVQIPDRDAATLTSIARCIGYLREHGPDPNACERGGEAGTKTAGCRQQQSDQSASGGQPRRGLDETSSTQSP